MQVKGIYQACYFKDLWVFSRPLSHIEKLSPLNIILVHLRRQRTETYPILKQYATNTVSLEQGNKNSTNNEGKILIREENAQFSVKEMHFNLKLPLGGHF